MGGAIAKTKRLNQLSLESRERTEILALYKECLNRNMNDPSIDCSEHRTAVEIVDR